MLLKSFFSLITAPVCVQIGRTKASSRADTTKNRILLLSSVPFRERTSLTKSTGIYFLNESGYFSLLLRPACTRINIIRKLIKNNPIPRVYRGIGSKIIIPPINKMGVTVSDLCDQFKKSQIFPIKKPTILLYDRL